MDNYNHYSDIDEYEYAENNDDENFDKKKIKDCDLFYTIKRSLSRPYFIIFVIFIFLILIAIYLYVSGRI